MWVLRKISVSCMTIALREGCAYFLRQLTPLRWHEVVTASGEVSVSDHSCSNLISLCASWKDKQSFKEPCLNFKVGRIPSSLSLQTDLSRV